MELRLEAGAGREAGAGLEKDKGVEAEEGTFLTCWLCSHVLLLWLVGGLCALSAVKTPVVLHFTLCSMVAPGVHIPLALGHCGWWFLPVCLTQGLYHVSLLL